MLTVPRSAAGGGLSGVHVTVVPLTVPVTEAAYIVMPLDPVVVLPALVVVTEVIPVPSAATVVQGTSIRRSVRVIELAVSKMVVTEPVGVGTATRPPYVSPATSAVLAVSRTPIGEAVMPAVAVGLAEAVGRASAGAFGGEIAAAGWLLVGPAAGSDGPPPGPMSEGDGAGDEGGETDGPAAGEGTGAAVSVGDDDGDGGTEGVAVGEAIGAAESPGVGEGSAESVGLGDTPGDAVAPGSGLGVGLSVVTARGSPAAEATAGGTKVAPTTHAPKATAQPSEARRRHGSPCTFIARWDRSASRAAPRCRHPRRTGIRG
jgi:hypothetical protein